MARTADKPGTYRIRQSGGIWKLSGVSTLGQRVRMDFRSELAAKRTAESIFPSPHSHDMPKASSAPVDDWGLPSQVPGLPTVDANVAGAVNAAMGIHPEPKQTDPLPDMGSLPEAEEAPEDKEKREASLRRAKSLCEFFGIAYASGIAIGSKKVCAIAKRQPANVPVKSVTELGKAATTAFQELVGDWEVGPWTMLLLLTCALPLTMLLQSRPLPKLETAGSDSRTSDPSSDGNLRAV